jgi:hypothetical protein
MNSKKSLTVEDLRMVNTNKDAAFRVVKVQNSLRFKIGEILSENNIERHCDNSWTVNIVGKK